MFREAVSLLVRDVKAIWHDCVTLRRQVRKAERQGEPFAEWEIAILRKMRSPGRLYSEYNSRRQRS